MTKQEIINTMVANGYNLMGRTVEWYEQNFTAEELQSFLERFLKAKA